MRQLDPAALFQTAFPCQYQHLNQSDVLKFPLPEGDAGPRTMYDWPPRDVEHDDSETHEHDDGEKHEDDERMKERFLKLVDDDEFAPTVEEGGTDVLACYVPWSLGGRDGWGIVWNEPALFRAAVRLSLRASAICPDVGIDMVMQCLRRTVRQHELFHFAVEYTAAHLSLQREADCYRPRFKDPDKIAWEERLATAWEMEWLGGRQASKFVPAPALKAIRDAWRETRRPSPYSQWEDAAGPRWLQAAEAHADALCGIPAAGRLYRDLLQLAPRSPTSGVVPEYSFGLSRLAALGEQCAT